MSKNFFIIEYNGDGKSSLPGGREWSCVNHIPVVVNYGGATNYYFFDSSGTKLCIIGRPFINDKIDNNKFSESYLSSEKSEDFLGRINGEFVLIEVDEKEKFIKIINSRFASPIFWYVAEGNYFLGSTSYYHLCLRLKQLNKFHLNVESFYGFLRFRRLFGESTYDKKSLYLKPAHVLIYSSENLNVVPYWKPSYEKNTFGLRSNADRLNSAIQNSIRRKTSDNKRYGMFLSGGMDTRTILANCDHPPHCFTLTYSQNREYHVAKTLASWKGAKHTWIPIHNGQCRENLDDSARITGGMYMVDGIFYGHSEYLEEYVDVIFAGYGFDYFFQGMYLPYKSYRLLGRELYYRSLYKIDSDIIEYFINNISYYTKGFPVSQIMKKNKRNEMNEYLQHAVSELVSEARNYSDNVFDMWEHISLGAVSRHYTYGGQLAMMELAEYRTIAYDNDLYDLYLELPVKQRFDAKVERVALRLADRRFYNYISANHSYPIKYSSLERSFFQILNSLKKRVLMKSNNDIPDPNSERTWKASEDILKTEMSDFVVALKDSAELASIGIFDMDSIRKAVGLWMEGKVVGNQTFLVLLTIERFIRQINTSIN